MTYCGAVVPNSSHRSKVPSPRLASAHDASTTAWPWAARLSGPPGSDGARAVPIARNRPFISVPAATAAAAVPPLARTASPANCADPAKTIAAVRIAWSGENPACRASTPNDIDSTNPTTAYGMPSRIPATNDGCTGSR